MTHPGLLAQVAKAAAEIYQKTGQFIPVTGEMYAKFLGVAKKLLTNAIDDKNQAHHRYAAVTSQMNSLKDAIASVEEKTLVLAARLSLLLHTAPTRPSRVLQFMQWCVDSCFTCFSVKGKEKLHAWALAGN
jgi:hypothetical protein